MSIMALQFPLAAVLILLSAASTTTTAAAAQALPGCSDKCGNLTIPYPFGMNERCSLGDRFHINCSRGAQLDQPPTAYLGDSNIIVTNISIDVGELLVLSYRGDDCYNKEGDLDYSDIAQFRLGPPYTISDTKNKFYAIGCDTYAIMLGFRGEEEFMTGCMSVCNSRGSVDKNFCSGAGCCQTNIPSGLNNLTVSLSSYYNHSYVWDFNPCSHAFIVQHDLFSFSFSSFEQLNDTERLPMVLNWAIGNDTDPCHEALKRKDFACNANSMCKNRPINGSVGYLCECSPGYEGNPYHPDGCKDIDECKALNPCENGQCLNSPPGNYSCSCYKGYKNDGMKICIKDDSKRHPVLLRIVSFGSGSSLGLILLAIAAWWLVQVIKKRKTKKRKEEFFKQNGGLVLQQQLSSGDQANVEKIKLFNSRELEKATDQFSIDRILGQGGQGTVYKGMLMDGQIVAVKKSKIVNGGEVRQFINEIVILSHINHRNVVKLLGCCLETEIPLLVYEFLPNGTLSQYIHDQDEEFPFTWGTRLRVSTEVAGALSYLHSAASIPIYHRDIKSTNILLDAKYRAKIADFGTSRSISIDQTHLTTLVHGTFGYLDPEYFQSSQFTEKSDVYSFGVVLVELLTGQKPVSMMRSQESRSLATHFLLSMEQNRLFDILDAQVMKDGSKEEIIAVANLAQRCLNLNGRKRPTMKEVAAELEGVQLAVKDADHVQQNLVGEGDVGTDEITTEAYCDVVSTSTGPFTDGGTAGSPSDVQPLLFYNTQ
ncbi:wall-associated receptor kinase-like 1 [Rosa sericea]